MALVDNHEPSLSPTLAIIIPVYKHSMFIAEAIESALQQECVYEYHIVIVNDGCPFIETHQTCLAYARSHPDKISYLRSTNGGLSAARNYGINYALTEFAGMKAVYLLDADNRLLSSAMQNAMTLLEKNDFCGWVYPDIDMFGYQWTGDFSGDYSVLMHLSNNICEAGSLVSRRLLDKGVRFDESMRLGYEDWEFWLQAISVGERGQHCENFGFQYRKRAESMLSDADRDNAEIISYMRRKHSTLFKTNVLLGLEQIEAPRYAIFLEDSREFILTTDPALPGEQLSIDEFNEIWWRANANPGRYRVPGFLAVTTRRVLCCLREARMLHWLFWRLEDSLAQENDFAFATLHNTNVEGLIEIDSTPCSHALDHRIADVAMVKSDAFHRSVLDPLTLWVDTLCDQRPEMNVFVSDVRIKLPYDWRGYGRAVAGLLSCLMDLRDSPFAKAAAKRWQWKDAGVPRRSDSYSLARNVARIHAPLFPLVPSASQKDVAFVLPLINFGGVEKVAFNLAEEFVNKGWRAHVIVLDAKSARIPPRLRQRLTSVSFLDDATTSKWDGRVYLGTADDERNQSGNLDRLVGLLSSMDLVINAHGGRGHGVMARLRRHGVKTANHLHVIDLSESGRPVGHPYLGLAYEHAYDYFLTCSYQLADWLHGMGVPSAKLIPVPNGPGYRLSEKHIADVWNSRDFGVPARELRVLYMGRLDRQKGLERVVEVLRLSKASDLKIDWRLVGASIIEDSTDIVDFEAIMDEHGHEPVYDEALLTSYYAWADVLLIPSHWEGLPLTIIEAMRLGCVVVATDVGAIAEVISHGNNGMLAKKFEPTHFLENLRELSNGAQLKVIATAARASVQQYTWENALANFDIAATGSRTSTLFHDSYRIRCKESKAKA